MSSRIPELLAKAEKQSSPEASEKVKAHAEEYEKAFLSYLMQYIREDEVLKDFYVRLVYECEIVQMVLHNRKTTELWELKDLVNDMKTATTIKEIAKADASFHRRLFSIAGEEQFYNWYQLQAQSLNNFLGGFWSYIGYKTENYERLMEIHSNIYHAIESQDVDLAVKSIQEHFSILLFQLLSVTFQKGSSTGNYNGSSENSI